MPVVSMIWNWGLHQVLDTYCMVFGVPDQTTYGEVCSVTAPVSAIAAAALANTALPWNNSDKYSKASQFIMILEKRQSDIFRTVFGCASGVRYGRPRHAQCKRNRSSVRGTVT